jgi:CTP:molybdopterin cytidylyltransferase MocA
MLPIKLGGVLLSAGASRRMGQPKAFLRLDGDTFVARGVGILKAAACDPVIVVIAPGTSDNYEAELGDGVQLVENPAPERGMLSSLAVGLEALPADVTHAMVTLVDAPLVRPATAQLLEEHCALVPELILVPTVDGIAGHPVVYPQEHWGRLAAWQGAEGARGYLAAHSEETCQVETGDPGVARDFDSPQDLPPGALS